MTKTCHSNTGSAINDNKVWLVPIFCVFILVFCLSFRTIGDLDLGFHLKGGKWIIENHKVPLKDTYTYTVSKNEYIDSHWLYQVFLYAAYGHIGYAGLTVLNCVLILLVFYLMFLRMKLLNIPLQISAMLLFLSVFAMEIRFNVRPEIFSWIFLISDLIILEQYYYGKKKYLFLFVIVQLFWTNMHGLFPLGWIVGFVYIVSTLFHKKEIDKVLIKYYLAGILVSLINPYFYKGMLYPIQLLTHLRGDVLKYFVSELKSTWSIKASENAPFFPVACLYVYYLLLVAAVTFFIITCKKRKIHELLIILGFTYLSLSAIRNVPLFVITVMAIMALSLKDMFSPEIGFINKIFKSWIIKPVRFAPVVSSIIILLISSRVVTCAYYADERRDIKFGKGLNIYAHPIRASQFLVKNRLIGKIINDYNSGGWLEWSIAQPVFMDGRAEVMGLDFLEEYLASFESNRLSGLIGKYDPDMIVLNNSSSLKWALQLRRMPKWRLIYVDELNSIYAIESYAVDFKAIDLNGTVLNMNIGVHIDNAVVWETLKMEPSKKIVSWIRGFYKKQEYPVWIMNFAIFCYQNNEFKAAESLYLDFLKKTAGNLYEVYFNLGSLYYRSKDYDKSIYCYERVLKNNPKNSLAASRISEMKINWIGYSPAVRPYKADHE